MNNLSYKKVNSLGGNNLSYKTGELSWGVGDNLVVFCYTRAFEIRPYKKMAFGGKCVITGGLLF